MKQAWDLPFTGATYQVARPYPLKARSLALLVQERNE